ncbi:MAG: hypothetical protein AAF721_21025 [Myxococcota bacterium]
MVVLDDCPELTALPDGIDVVDLSMRNCSAFERWPRWMRGDLARLDLRGCAPPLRGAARSSSARRR